MASLKNHPGIYTICIVNSRQDQESTVGVCLCIYNCIDLYSDLPWNTESSGHGPGGPSDTLSPPHHWLNCTKVLEKSTKERHDYREDEVLIGYCRALPSLETFY